MQLKKILQNIEHKVIQGNTNTEITDLSYDSRKVTENMAFVCLIGIDTDGHNYIEQAIKKGATCIIICKDVTIKNPNVTVIKIKDTRTQLSLLSANFFNHPDQHLIKIAITGTKGKTSISWMLKSILEQNNNVALIGTTGTYINNKKYEHKNTTPESYLIQKYMSQAVTENVKYLIMETSSTALQVGRINNITFDYAIFTNMSMDHIGPREHKTYEEYIEAKSKLFKQSLIGIINKDDKEYQKIIKNATCKIYTYGQKDSDIIIKNIEHNIKTLETSFKLEGIINNEYEIKAPGIFSAYNATSAIAICKLLKIDDKEIKQGLKNYYAPGRCKIIDINNKCKVIIDFAHNNNSIQSIISSVRYYNPNKIITVFGCGGGRSQTIRYELGKITGKLSDYSIITTDNPRNDDINEINKDIEKGINESAGKYEIIIDRKEAILKALEMSKENDIILLLGKGHEKYQEIKGKIIPFDEEQIVNEYTRGKHGN